MKAKSLLFLLLAGVSLSACAQSDAPAMAKPASEAAKPAVAQDQDVKVKPGTPAARAREALRKLNPTVNVDSIEPAPLPGFQEAVVGGQVLYISDDGKYLMQGVLLDVEAKKNLAEVSLAKVRRELLKKLPQADRIVFAPPNPKYHVAVFTDVECGYCRKLHGEIAQYNQQGIAVEYLAFPRMGPASEDFRKMEAVWCAPDRRAALTAAKNDKAVPKKTCKNPVAMQYELGQRAGLTGTPMILAEDGTQLGGYLPPADLRAALDKMAAEAAPAKKASGGA